MIVFLFGVIARKPSAGGLTIRHLIPQNLKAAFQYFAFFGGLLWE
jgi:hypothetical protein